MEWWHSGSPRSALKKFRVQKSTGKVLASIFLDQDGILLIDYLPKGQTINTEYHSSLLVQLKDILKSSTSSIYTCFLLSDRVQLADLLNNLTCSYHALTFPQFSLAKVLEQGILCASVRDFPLCLRSTTHIIHKIYSYGFKIKLQLFCFKKLWFAGNAAVAQITEDAVKNW